ncbi:glycerate kinase [Acinetobacter sp. NEB149]|jgi:glycerate 2-kinase|uniref:glycerate kinase n=1 Tax=Acinetobacter TaxID=469 RepID=UPI00110D1F94|nr:MULTISPECIES: glycerate kinase [Acinetobacter]MCU4449024.1 glycerate kinase [Acinetobacter lwoffii]QJB47693.1 glycerate kinase [Acinetobacter sp. NEB149]TMS44756.1 glycerate kinase [Acinetobacter lwoffii]
MSLTFVLAPDSFKESMSAAQVCQAMQRGIQNVIPDAHIIHVPMADGGEGTVDALISSLKGQSIACEVTGPLPEQRIQTYWGLIDAGQTAVIEMAKANGIHLLKPSQRNPMLTSTYGTGEMIKQALDLSVKKIIMGSGGSITNDGGAGMAQALGVQFLNHAGELIQVCGGNLELVKSMDLSELDPRLADTEIIIASDVNNPLCGPNGASIIFGPQKGAMPEMVKQLDQNFGYFADVVAGQFGRDYRHVAGAGAAGGLGFGLMAFTAASIRSGVELMIEQVQLNEKIAQADYVLTGEGKIDSQTSLGKTPFGVAQLAKQFNKPVIAFAGLIGEGIEDLFESGFSQIIGINPPDCPLEEALKNAEMNLEKAVAEIVKNLLTE